MADSPIRVTIFDHTTLEHCSVRCGVERMRDEVDFIAQHLNNRYGAGVEVEYIDLAHSPQHVEIRERIRAQNLPLPVVAINGVFRLAGSLQYRAIADGIEALLELGHRGRAKLER
jgi:short-subunit dehydrogenase